MGIEQELHLEIALIRAIQTLSEVSLENVIDALENLRGGPDSLPVKEIKPIDSGERVLPLNPPHPPAETKKKRMSRMSRKKRPGRRFWQRFVLAGL